MGYNIHGFYNAGDATDSNGVVTTNLRGIETILKSAQDDNIFIQTGSNPGYDYPVLSDFATATVHGMPGESQKFRDLFFSSSNTWDLKSYDWNNNLNIVYKEPSIEFNYL
jgi:hypothetical protein